MFNDLISIVLILIIPRLLSGSLVSFLSTYSPVSLIGVVMADMIMWYPSEHTCVLPHTCVFSLKVPFSNGFVDVRYGDTSFLALGLDQAHCFVV